MKKIQHIKHFYSFVITVFFLLVIHTLPSYSQSQLLSHFTVNNGLTSNTVYRCLQDSKGFMWFATESGVTRYDGFYFDRFTVNDGLSDNEVMNLFEDSSGRIWFLTLNGKLSYYFNGSIHNEHTDSWLSFGYNGLGIQNMFEDDDGNLWVAHFRNRLVRFSKDGVNKIYDLPVYEPEGSACTICGNNSSLFIYNEEHTELYLYFNLFNLKYNKAKDDFDFLGENSGIIRSAFFYENKHTAVYLNGDFQIVFVNGTQETVVADTGKEGYWAMRSRDGVFYYSLFDGTTWSIDRGVKKKLASFEGLDVNFLYEDSSDNLWVCTRSGIYQYSDEARTIAFWNEPYDFSGSKILSMIMDKDGRCLAGMYDRFLYSVSREDVRRQEVWNESEDCVRIKRMMWFGDSLLMATRNGVFIRKPNGKITKMDVELSKRYHGLGSINDLARDQNGKLWIATSVGLLRADPRKRIMEGNKDLTYWNLRTPAVFVDTKNQVWFSNTSGFHKLKIIDDKLGPVQTFFDDRILKIGETEDQKIIALSETSGLYVCNDNGIQDTVPIDACNKDMVVRGNDIWVATNNGIYFFKLNDGRVVGSDHYGFSDGLPSLEVTALELDGGLIYAGTSGGIAILSMQHHNAPKGIQLVYTRSVTGTWCCSPNEIDYLNNNITIDFSAVLQQQQEFVEFRYRFDHETNWKSISGRRLELSQLPWGNHNVIIAARYAQGEWLEAAPIHFNVHPPFWYQWWFILSLSLLFLGIVWGVIYVISRRRLAKLQQQLAVNEERERIAADLHDDIGADLTRISLNAEILKQNITSPEQTGLANKIIHQSSDLRRKADQIIWALNPTYDSTFDLIANINSYLHHFLENTSISFESKNATQINTPLSALQRRTIFLLIKELSNNTVKHSGASKIEVTVEEKGGLQIWTYADNGVGCKPEVFFGTLRNGVRNMQKRLREIDGHLSLLPSSDFSFRVEIILPIQTLSFTPVNKP